MMIGVTVRAICVAALAALAAAVCSALAYAMQPPLTLEMDRDLPRNVSGVYPPEFVSGQTFAWTSGRAKVSLPGLDRRVPWTCAVRFRGGRSAPLPQPTVDLQVDGVTLGSQASDQRAAGSVGHGAADEGPRRPDPDNRGVESVRSGASGSPRAGCPDRLAAVPARRVRGGTAAATRARGVHDGRRGFWCRTDADRHHDGSAVGAAVLLAAAQAVPMSAGFAPYTTYVDRTVPLAFWIVLGMVSIVAAADRGSGQRLRQTARFVVAFSAGALYLKLLGQLHPSKPLVDALFQAHRLEWVMAGRYFFTQPMPGGVQFPYAIGSVRRCRTMGRLRSRSCGAPAHRRVHGRGDRRRAPVSDDRAHLERPPGGAVATVLFSVVPISAVVIGNANLTNAFGRVDRAWRRWRWW